MSLESLGINLRIKLVLATSWFFENTAKLFGYPNTSSGMPMVTNADAMYGMPVHQPRVPPSPDPNNLFEAIFGNVPQSSTIEKFYYESTRDGYYNFYIDHFRNVIFLPDWLSKWIQLTFDIGVDTANLEIIRDTLFSLSVYFMFFLQFRTMLYYFITINPYTRPWIYLISISDWIYDLLFHLGITRRATFFGFPLLSLIVNGVAGVIADALNHVVFTMPFLPSEGQAGQVLINGAPREVIIFRYLPSLWFSNPIPEKLREFWYIQRPDIYKFMKTNYGHLDIDFLPNRVLKQVYESQQGQIGIKSFAENTDKLKVLSSQVFYDLPVWSNDLGHYLNEKPELVLNSLVEHLDKLI
jgi:hypothetical protein|tara:strand:- start:358 stop:1419 length:1062 start_codon:yes stop_codon:yes gene_type:complete